MLDSLSESLLPDEPGPLKTELINESGFEIQLRFGKTEYNHDDEDKNYISKFNKRKDRKANLTIKLLEQIIDRFEKLALFEFYRTGQSVLYAKKHVIVSTNCDICGSSENTRNNKIVRCQYCYVCVHQECYGILYVPIDKWTCRRCGIHPTVPVKCALCPYEGGAMKFTTSNSAVHQLCAIWLNGVTLGQNPSMEPVELRVPHLNKYKCDLCGITYGAVLRCAYPDCTENYHITCAAISGTTMEIEMNNPDGPKYIRKIFCLNHSRTPNYEIKTRINKVHAHVKPGPHGKRFSPIDIRARPIPENYLTSDYVSPQISDEDISIIHDYWLVKRLRTFGTPMINRLKVIYDRLAEPTRALKYETIPKVNRAARMRVTVEPIGNGSLKIVGDFAKAIEVYDDRGFHYLQNVFSNDPDDCRVDLKSKAVIERDRKLFCDEIRIQNLEHQLLLSTDLKETTQLIIEIVKEYVDPAMPTDFAEYRYSDKISPWDIIGIMFFAACPENLHAIAFLNALKYIDDRKMFMHFNCNSPHHVNISTMCRKAIYPGYSNMDSLIDDFNKMMLPINSPFVKNQRLQYAKRFEESACYLLLSKPYGQVINLMLDGMDTVEDKNRILLHHLLHELTDCENIDPILKKLTKKDKSKLQAVTDYVRNVITAEKKQTLPNLDLVVDLYRRRNTHSLDEKLIIVPKNGFAIISSERAFIVKELLMTPKFNFPKLSWNECLRFMHRRDGKGWSKFLPSERKIFDLKSVKKNLELKMSLRKRTNGGHHEEPASKKRRTSQGSSTPNNKITNYFQKDANESPRSPKKAPSKSKKIPLSLIAPNSPRQSRQASTVKYYHDTIVIINKCSIGEHIAGRVIDPRVIEETDSHEYDYVMSLSNVNQKQYSCVRLFTGNHRKQIEWVKNVNIKIVNMVKLCRYIEDHEREIDEDTSMQSLKAAAHYYLKKQNSHR